MEKFDLLMFNVAHALLATVKGTEVNPSTKVEKVSKVETTKAVTEEKPLPNPKRKVYTNAEPAKTKVEKELYMIQWGELGEKGLQDDYLAGKCDSLGNPLEVKEEAASDDFGDFGDFEGGESEAKKDYTPEQVREALQKYAKDNGREEAYKVLATVGAKKIADIEPKDFATVMAEVE